MAGAIYGYAYGGSEPEVMGHSWGEIDSPDEANRWAKADEINWSTPISDYPKLAGSSLVLNKHPTTGGWARGLDYQNTAGSTRIGGIGMLGTNTNPTSINLGFGISPWSNTNRFSVKSNGDICMGSDCLSSWSETSADSGTLCGMAPWGVGKVKCKGVTLPSCPSGYTYNYFQMSSKSRWGACVKN